MEKSLSEPTPSALITTDNVQYSILLPSAETDDIQHFISNNAEPYEHEMLKAMKASLRPGELVLDVGANIGNHSLYLAMAAQALVIAYEPDPRLSKTLERSALQNDARVTVVNVALGALLRQSTLVDDADGNLGGQHLSDAPDAVGQKVPVERLDDQELPGPVSAIKIDVEGHEVQVLEGASQLLRRDRPDIWVECLSYGMYLSVTKILRPIGYRFNALYNSSPTFHFSSIDGPVQDAHEERVDQLVERYYADHAAYLSTRSLLKEADEKYASANRQLAEIRSRTLAGHSDAAGGSTARVDPRPDPLEMARQSAVDRARDLELALAGLASKHSRLAIEADAQISELLTSNSDIKQELDNARLTHDQHLTECANSTRLALEQHHEQLQKADDEMRRLRLLLRNTRAEREDAARVVKNHAESLAASVAKHKEEEAVSHSLRIKSEELEKLNLQLVDAVKEYEERLAASEERVHIAAEQAAASDVRLAEAQDAHSQLLARQKYLRTDFNVLREYVANTTADIKALKARNTEAAHEFSRLNEAHRKTANQNIRRRKEIEGLNRTLVELQSELDGLRASRNDERAVSEERLRTIQELRQSKTYRAGTALRRARSGRGIILLIPTLYRIFRRPRKAIK
ncbi:FkbM family methyltransferase [Janibacter terrae]|uniref:FkbM family methyltransferase n=1 Tax=Janibacter terrae TaxID=103817 RepID=UPI0009EDBE89|nr:FkbM family methyltransferase [Janibacter terrae]